MVKTPFRFLFALTIFVLAAGGPVWGIEGTGKASVLDGKMDDACWQNAAVARDFVLLPKGSPTQKIEVRLAYDARCLYIFWRVFEAQPARLSGISPEPGRDHLDLCVDQEARGPGGQARPAGSVNQGRPICCREGAMTRSFNQDIKTG